MVRERGNEDPHGGCPRVVARSVEGPTRPEDPTLPSKAGIVKRDPYGKARAARHRKYSRIWEAYRDRDANDILRRYGAYGMTVLDYAMEHRLHKTPRRRR